MDEGTFWGVEIKPGKAQPYVPPPEDAKLHLSQATLALDAKPGEKVGITCKIGGEDEDGQEVLICSLREGNTESQSLDLIFDQYTEFKVQGNSSVHLTGYYMPEYEEEEEDEDEEDEDVDFGLEEYQLARRYPSKILFDGADETDEEDDEDEYDEEEDEDDEDEDDEEEEEDVEAREEPMVVIKELNNDGTERAEEDEDEDEDQDDEEDVAPEDLAKMEEAVAEAAEALQEAADDAAAEAAADAIADAAADAAGTAPGEAMEQDTSVPVTIHSGKESKRKSAIEGSAAASKKMKIGSETRAVPMEVKSGRRKGDAAVAEPTIEGKRKGKKNGKASQDASEEAKSEGDDVAAVSIPITAGRPNIKKFDNGFIIEDTHMGPSDGKVAKDGQKVAVRYRGTLGKNGKVFDETKGNKTFTFRLGVGEVIKGWDRGVRGMRVGDKRRLTVPPQMAYGSSGVRGAIPPNATLVFDVELVDVKGKPAA